MKKRLLAIFCILAILLGMIVVPALAETAEEATGYEVGYAKVDVNPWVDLTLADGTTIGISASDSTITAEDATKYIVETQITNPVNASETITQKIVAVPLGGYGNSTERLASAMMDDNGDGIVGYGDGLFSTCTTVTDANGKTVAYVTIDCIRASDGMTRDIRNAVVAAIGSANISADQIMVSASHSHSAPDYGYSKQNTVWKAYYDYVIARIASAAKEAFDTKSTAEMSKGSIEAPDAMSARDYGDGISLNFVRQAYGTYTLKEQISIFSYTYWKQLGTDTLVRTSHSGQDFTKTVDGTKYQASFSLEDEVSEADETLHVLQFTREEGAPVLLVNWRAHAAMNGSGTNPVISSDYVGSLRHTLENAGYCVGFWQGASGNINAGIIEDFQETLWKSINVNGLGTGEETLAARYGYLVAEAALACLDTNMQDCEEGKISTRQSLFNAERQVDSAGMIAAAKACQAEIDAGTSITYPYAYKHSDGNYYVINSSYHLAQVVARETRTGTIPMELNVMTLGKDVALVTLPVEPFDRYSNDATMSDTTDNDWDDLIGDVYGTPFVLGYSNGHEGYLPNALAYTYKPANSTFLRFYGEGSYESNTAKTAQGEGEAVIEELGNMFEVLATGYRTAECEACGTEVQWTPLTKDQLGIDLAGGHYYLAEDITATTVLDNYYVGSSDSTESVCLDLNGKILDYKGQVFLVYADSVLNIMDTATEGKIIARSGGDLTGGLAWVHSGGTLNLHGGTLQFIKDTEFTGNHTARGGVIYNSGTLNVYDGTIVGGEIVVSDWKDSSTGKVLSPNGVGGAVAVVGGSATLNMFGGRIEAGPSVDGVMGSCVYVTRDSNASNGYHAINLTGDAYIEEIYVYGHYTTPRSISISGKYTGSVALNLDSSIELADEVYVARVVDGADFSEATLRCVNEPAYTFEVSSSNANRLIMVKAIYDAVIDGVKYESLTDAITNYAGGEIQLLRDVTEDAVAENTNDVYLDLNGFDIKSVNVAEGTKLTCWDFQTYDYTVEDEFGYGIIGSVTGAGTLDTIPVGEDGYVMLGTDTNDDGIADQNVSFHHVDLALTDMTLRPKSAEEDTCNPSMYYKSNFAGDEIVKANVGTFGVALSLVEMPDETNMGVNNKFSWFENEYFQAGGNDTDATSTLLYGIMMESNGRMTNTANASRRIYGRAYIQLTDGSYVFGNGHTVTLQALTESADDQWEDCSSEQMEGLVTMYETYQKIMKNWDLTSIPAAYDDYLASEDEVLKILVIGNSHGQDATTMLNEIFKTEAPGKKVVIGALYKSGCLISEHADFMTTGKANYDYLKNGNYDGTNADGSWQRANGVTADVALRDECWDYVIMQQLNHYSGMASLFSKKDFMTIINYVENKVASKPTFLWHMVWANPDDAALMNTYSSDADTQVRWNNLHISNFPSAADKTVYDRTVLYNSITKYAKQFIVNNSDGNGDNFLSKNYFQDVMPSATVIQYAQNAEIGYTQAQLYRDYTHLSDFGRLITGYLWYAKLMGMEQLTADDVTITELPAVLHQTSSTFPVANAEGKYLVTAKMREDIVKAVNYTLTSPYAVP